MITMQEMMIIQKEFNEQREEFNKQHNVGYSSIDSTGISLTAQGVSLSFYRWDKAPKITYNSCNKDMPETFDEFSKIKKDKEQIEKKLIDIAMEWKSIRDEKSKL